MVVVTDFEHKSADGDLFARAIGTRGEENLACLSGKQRGGEELAVLMKYSYKRCK